MKNLTFVYCFIVLFLSGVVSNLSAQKFEGTLTYKIYYIPKSKLVTSKNLELQYGNKEIGSIKNGFYKSERKYNDDVLKTTIFDNVNGLTYIQPNQTNYWIKDQVSSDIAKKIVKIDTAAFINNYPCAVYRFAKTALKVTFFVSKEKFAGKNTDNYWFTYPTNFQGPVVRLVVEYPDYTLTQELTSVDSKTIDNKVFDTKDDLIVLPVDDISNTILEPAKRRELLQCMYKSIGYPGFLQLNKIEGKIVVELFIDNAGILKSSTLHAEYFKKQEESIRIYNTQKIKSLEDKSRRKVLPLVQQCLAGYKFDAPVSNNIKVNTIFRIPFVFSKSAADVAEENQDVDEQEIDESFYDDFDEFY
jgi:hypothetical protein